MNSLTNELRKKPISELSEDILLSFRIRKMDDVTRTSTIKFLMAKVVSDPKRKYTKKEFKDKKDFVKRLQGSTST